MSARGGGRRRTRAVDDREGRGVVDGEVSDVVEAAGLITTDDFTKEQVRSPSCDVKALMAHRAARSRFFDELALGIMEYLEENFSEGSWKLAFDGLDPRGATRPIGERRVAGILSNDTTLSEILQRDVSIGEGDLKLTDVHQRVFGSPLVEGKLALLWTIDTDSLLIELAAHAKRVSDAPNADLSGQRVILCFREPAVKRKDGYSRDLQFAAFDVPKLYGCVIQTLFGTMNLAPAMEVRRRAAVALFVAAVAACGCDFLEIKGFRCDHIVGAIRELVVKNSHLLDCMSGAWAGESTDGVLAMIPALEKLVGVYGDQLGSLPRMKKARASVMDTQNLQLRRLCWTAAYWHQNEQKNLYDFGFCAAGEDE